MQDFRYLVEFPTSQSIQVGEQFLQADILLLKVRQHGGDNELNALEVQEMQ